MRIGFFIGALLLVVLPVSLWADPQVGESFEFPLRLSLTMPGAETFFYTKTESSLVINTFQTFSVRDAAFTPLADNTWRVELSEPLRFTLSNRQGDQFFGERVIRSFLIQPSQSSALASLAFLEPGDLVSTRAEATEVMEETRQRALQTSITELMQDIDQKRFLPPPLQSVRFLDFTVSVQELGRSQGAPVETMTLRVRNFANIHLSGPDYGGAQSLPIEKVLDIIDPRSWLAFRYQEIAEQVVARRQAFLEAGWGMGPSRPTPKDWLPLAQTADNVLEFPRCSLIFGR